MKWGFTKIRKNVPSIIGFEMTSRPFGFDDALDQGLCKGLMFVKSASAED